MYTDEEQSKRGAYGPPRLARKSIIYGPVRIYHFCAVTE